MKEGAIMHIFVYSALGRREIMLMQEALALLQGAYCNMLHHTSAHCTATCCNTLHLQCAETHFTHFSKVLTATCCNTLQHAATCCNTLQHSATTY